MGCVMSLLDLYVYACSWLAEAFNGHTAVIFDFLGSVSLALMRNSVRGSEMGCEGGGWWIEGGRTGSSV